RNQRKAIKKSGKHSPDIVAQPISTCFPCAALPQVCCQTYYMMIHSLEAAEQNRTEALRRPQRVSNG
ncbi:unnamed protein product, partial [Prorocentrum cordatum]